MKNKILALILISVISLFGCSASKSPAETLPDEEYEAEALAVRQSFDDFCEDIFKKEATASYLMLHYTLKDPEAYGITDYSVDFGDLSLESLTKDQEYLESLSDKLTEFDADMLDADQQLTYKILEKALKYEISFSGLELYYQPLIPSTGLQSQLPLLLTEYIFYDRSDVDDYLLLLSDIDRYFAQIINFENEKADAGLCLTDSCIDKVINECQPYIQPINDNMMCAGFDSRIDVMSDLSDEEKEDYKARDREVVQEHFIPAYELLIEGLNGLKGRCINDKGLYYDPAGKAYYEYLVKSSVGPTYALDKLGDAIRESVDSALSDMYQLYREYPEIQEESMDFHFSESEPEAILNLLKDLIAQDFPQITDYSYTIRYVPEELQDYQNPAFFLVPPIDDYKNSIIYINPGSSSNAQTLFTTLAHEGIPGHLYQTVYFLSNCDSDLRKVLSFNGYSEGWATYVEYYSYTLDNGISNELGELLAVNSSAMLGIYAYTDLYVNYYGWGIDEVKEFLDYYFALDDDDDEFANAIYEAMLDDPSGYLTYYAGYLEIENMKDQAQRKLKKQFSLEDFNRFILDIGPAPFEVIDEYFNEWLKAQ